MVTAVYTTFHFVFFIVVISYAYCIIFRMAVYEIFKYPVFYRYKTTLCSKATVVVIFLNFITYITPLLLAYRSYGFWLRSDVYVEQPTVKFKHEFLLIAETGNLDGVIICSTFDELNIHLKKKNRCPVVKTREVDTNFDGMADAIDFEIDVQLYNEEEIYSVKLLLLFDYQISALVKLHMESIGIIQHSAALPGARLDVITELKFEQRRPLIPSQKFDKRFNISVFGETNNLKNYQLTSVLKNYSSRNVTTRFHNAYEIWQSGRVTNEPFTLNAHILISEQTIVYQPGFWQVIKWAWLQYIALFVIVKYFTSCIEKWIFTNHMIPVIKMSPPWIKPF